MNVGLGVAVLISCLGWAAPARSWNAAGHETVGAIADHLIAGTPAAAQVNAILGMELRTAAVWADCVKGVSLQDGEFRYTVSARYRECRPIEDAAGQARMVDYVARNSDACHRGIAGHSGTADDAASAVPCHKQYHYTDVAIERDQYVRSEVGTSDHDIVAAITAAVRVLQDRPAPAPFSIKDKREALLMLVHFVGDLHQPLHVGAIYLDPAGHEVDPDRGTFDPDTETRGGNQLLEGHRVLHTEWDDIARDLGPDHLVMSGDADARALPKTAGPPAEWSMAWAGDTLRVSHAVFDGVIFGAENLDQHTWPMTLPPGYAERREALQRRQLVVAGARLAEIVERLFPPPGHRKATGTPRAEEGAAHGR